MKPVAVFVLLLGCGAAVFAAEEKPLATKIASLGLFKNGLAIVERTTQVDAPGVYRVEDVPEPVHGTFWIESDATVSTRVTRRTVEVPLAEAASADFQEGLAGRDVVIHFSEPGLVPTEGTVLAIEPPHGSAAWNRRYEQPAGYYWYGAREYGHPTGATSTGRYLLLRTKDGTSYVDGSKIACLEAKGESAMVRQRKAVLLFTVGAMNKKNATLSIRYLTKGMAWAPSYRVDISDPKTLTLRQGAALRNELEPFENAQLRLISGFPSM
jgi:hypothetical protein